MLFACITSQVAQADLLASAGLALPIITTPLFSSSPGLVLTVSLAQFRLCRSLFFFSFHGLI